MNGREELNNLMVEFDEMDYTPWTLCFNPDAAARDWKVRLMCAVDKIEREARKKTAKEILQTLYNNNERPQFMEVYIKTLADKYSVEVDNAD